MIRFIQDEFDNILHHTDWMDSDTKTNAYKKSRRMKAIVGYPEELENDHLVTEHYKEVRINWHQVTQIKTNFSCSFN